MTKYFDEKFLNTEIKHNILKRILKKSISITSVSSYRETEDYYTYVDLYAGEGRHDDGTLGSPLIALETIKDIRLKNQFTKYQCVLIEKEKERCEILEKNINDYITQNDITIPLEIFPRYGEWEKYTPEIINILKKSHWGLIFADPFANQINMNLFIETLNIDFIYSCKDILIFLNFRSLQRLIGLGNEKLTNLVSNFFGISEKELKEFIENDEKGNINFNIFNKLIFDRLKGLKKEFITGCALPNTKEGKLTNSDYYFLIFCSTDHNMIDEFFKSYLNEISIFKNDLPLSSSIEQKVSEELRQRSMSFLDLYISIISDFVSWKTTFVNDIPTLNHIIDYLNELIKKGSIKVEAKDNDVFSKREKEYKKIKLRLTKYQMEGIVLKNEI